MPEQVKPVAVFALGESNATLLELENRGVLVQLDVLDAHRLARPTKGDEGSAGE